MDEQKERKTYRGGLYGLCRHSGVWFFFFCMVCFGVAALPTPFLYRGLFYTALNIIYSYFQDKFIFPKTIIPAKGGDVIAFEAIEPGCHYNGRIAYWYCPECEQVWQDEALTQLTNSKNVILPALKDSADYVAAKDATCSAEGNVEYWFCAECEQVWVDEALTQLSNLKNVIIPATGEVEEPDSPVTGDSNVAVVVALLTLIASGVAVSVLKNKKHA